MPKSLRFSSVVVDEDDDDDDDDDDDEDLLNYRPFSLSQESRESDVPEKKEEEESIGDGDENCSAAKDDDANDIDYALVLKQSSAISIFSPDLEKITPSSLVWVRVKGNNFPCRICSPDEAIGLDFPASWDETKKTLIQYIEFPGCLGDRELKSRGTIIPYHGNNSTNEGNGMGEWSSELCENYEKYLRKKVPARWGYIGGTTANNSKAEILFLKRILDQAKEKARKLKIHEEENAQKEEEQSLQEIESPLRTPKRETGSDDDLDEPYTQDWGNGSDSDGNYDVNASAVSLRNPKKTEPIRPGDVISYYSHVYVSGDKRGLREASVISVNARGDPILTLSNGEFLPRDMQIKRRMIMRRGKLEEHPGVFRQIDHFKLSTNLGSNLNNKIETESDRVSKIVNRKMSDMKKRMGNEGIPLDFLHKYGKRDDKPQSRDTRANKKKYPAKDDKPRRRTRLEMVISELQTTEDIQSHDGTSVKDTEESSSTKMSNVISTMSAIPRKKRGRPSLLSSRDNATAKESSSTKMSNVISTMSSITRKKRGRPPLLSSKDNATTEAASSNTIMTRSVDRSRKLVTTPVMNSTSSTVRSIRRNPSRKSISVISPPPGHATPERISCGGTKSSGGSAAKRTVGTPASDSSSFIGKSINRRKSMRIINSRQYT